MSPYAFVNTGEADEVDLIGKELETRDPRIRNHMTDSNNESGGKYFPALLLLFVGSGCAALIYEIVWFHILRLVIGATTMSIGVLLASFMGGMCAGSLLFPALISPKHHPLRVYAMLEIAIGAIGIALLFALPALGHVYTESVGYGSAGILLRAAVCAAGLLPPTILMGATLPALARWMETSRIGVSRLGMFYGANIAGAVLGTLFAGFYLLRIYDTHIATFFAAFLNLAVAGVALVIAKNAPFTPAAIESDAKVGGGSRSGVYLVIGLSGAVSMGAQVIWTRLLALLFGATTYTFTLILAVFLIGLGIGSAIGSWLARTVQRPGIALLICQIAAIICVAYASIGINNLIPTVKYGIDANIWDNTDRTTRYFSDLAMIALAIFPATVAWGASFPLALAVAARQADDPGRLVGRVYAANTVGAIVGSLFFAIVAISTMGTMYAQRTMVALAAISALVMLWSYTQSAAKSEDKGPGRLAWTGGIAVVALICTAMIRPIPDEMIGYGREIQRWDASDQYHYIAEGRDASIAVSHSTLGHQNFHVSGKVVASNLQIDMRIQRMLGHVPALMHENPKTVLVVGCGAGVTAGSFLKHPSIERIVICEIEPKVVEASSQWFAAENYGVLTDPRTTIIFDDARHFLRTTKEKFDIITSDPIHPWVRGAASMYTEEYFEICKKHLNPGGVVTQWVPMYETHEAAVKSQVGTFMRAFPDGTLWNSDINHQGYDLVVCGQVEPTKMDFDKIRERVDSNPELLRSLADVDIGFLISFLNMYAGQGRDLETWLIDTPVNLDRNLRLQYLAGMSLDWQRADKIYASMARFRKYPENLIIASPETEAALRQQFDKVNAWFAQGANTN